MTKKIGFPFGAGAELAYGMPSGGKIALDMLQQRQKQIQSNQRKIGCVLCVSL